jgi:small subunit ribosomal protein S16
LLGLAGCRSQNPANVIGFIKRFFGMVKIRLARGGAKKRPFYHIIVADSRSKRDGRRIERIGFFNPMAKGQEERLRLDLERVDYWAGVGAQLSERVQSLVSQARSSAAA